MLPAVTFLAATLYWPGFVLASNTPRFIFLSVAVPLLCAGLRFTWTHAHTLGALWLGYAALSLAWTGGVYDGMDAWWMFALWAGAFCIGSATENMEPAILGFAAGVAVSGLLAVVQVLGEPVVLMTAGPAGLFVNKAFMANAAVMAVAGLLVCRHPLRWLLLPACAAAWLLPMSKGAVAAGIAVVMVGMVIRTRSGVLFGLAAMLAVAVIGIPVAAELLDRFDSIVTARSLAQRWEIWRPVLGGMTWLGHGVGSFESVFPALAALGGDSPLGAFVPSPDRAHNDVLALINDTGVMALLPMAMVAIVFRRRWRSRGDRDIAFLPLVAFLACGLFWFPLYNPATGFLGALCLGHLCRPGERLRADLDDRRAAL